MRRVATAVLAGMVVGVISAESAAHASASAFDDMQAIASTADHALSVQVVWADERPAESVSVVVERSATDVSNETTLQRTDVQKTGADGIASWSLPPSHDDAFVADALLRARVSYAIDTLTVERVFALQSTRDTIRLPERAPEAPQRRVTVEGFVPSVHGFRFRNRFEGYPIPHSGLDHIKLPIAPRTYGLCGGMSLAVMEYFAHDRAIPAQTAGPSKDDALYQYLYRQQRRTLGARGEMVLKYAAWMGLADEGEDGTQHRTTPEIDAICAQIDAGELVLTGLVLADAENGRAIWRNHQVVAFGYEDIGRDSIRLMIYDPNYPGRDDVSIIVQRVPIDCGADEESAAEFIGLPGHLGCSCRMGQRIVRGIFMHDDPQ